MTHAYDHSCFCPDCCGHEDRLAYRLRQEREKAELRNETERMIERQRELRLELIPVK